ncbi:hypothetical protein CHS0354_013814 [Potamilus streckersoni]|uniref:Knl1 C-terminal RWD domain-containing protein n=1 Tax=Potamilus streckersoni TaxID=2493646 RepID=A0AAE0VWH9_9BIVA|nr:hypothetical protein CHS0354_013814 [Potamilus streckersoni]
MESKAGLIRNNRRQKSEERTSSILKPVSTERSALTDVDLNQKDGCDIPMKKARKSSRRVSFAETYIVKEYIRESPHPWTVDNEDEPEENERDTPQEPYEPGNQTITGFDKLLTGTIWTQHDTGEVDQFQELLEYPLPPDSDDSIHASHLSTISQTILCNSSMDLTTCENVPPDNVYDTLAPDDFGHQEQKERASSVLERILNHGKQAPMQERKLVPDLRRKSRSPLESLARCSENDNQHVICTTSSPVQPFWLRVDQSDGDEDNDKSFLSHMFDTRKNAIPSQASFSQDKQINEMNENACQDDAVTMELTEVFPSCIQKEEEDCGKISVQSLLQKFAKPSQVADETNDPKILDNTITETYFGQSDKTVCHLIGMEMTECLTNVIETKSEKQQVAQGNNINMTSHQSFGMEMTECSTDIINNQADSSKRNVQKGQDKTLHQSFGMEITKCLLGVIDTTAESNKNVTDSGQNKTLQQSFGMEMTECLSGIIDTRADCGEIIGEKSQKRNQWQSFGMEMPECVKNVIVTKGDCNLSSVIDTSTDSNKKTTEKSQNQTLYQSFGMEMTECLSGIIDSRADNGKKVTKTNQDKTLRQSFGMEMTECLPSAIDFGADNSKITKTNQDKTLRQSLGMEMTECLPSVIDFRADSSKITKTNQDKTLRQSLGMEMTECLPSAINFRADSSKITKTNQDKTLRQSLGMEMTECLPSAFDFKVDSSKITKTNQDKTLRQSLGMEMTECLPSAFDFRADNSKITKTNQDKTLRQSFGMEMTECLPSAIDFRADSFKITKTNQDKTLRQSLGMEMTECLPCAFDFRADSSKITKTNQDKTLRQSLGMEMTECLPSAFDFRSDSSKITKTNQDKTLRQSLGMEMTECLSGVIDTIAESNKITKTRQDKIEQQSLGMEMTDCIQNVILTKDDSKMIIIDTNQSKTLYHPLEMDLAECLFGSGQAEKQNLGHKAVHLSEGMEMTSSSTENISNKQDSAPDKLRKADRTKCHSLDLESTVSLQASFSNDNQDHKDILENIESTQILPLGMELTECLTNIFETSIEIDTLQAEKNITQFQSFEMDMTACVGNTQLEFEDSDKERTLKLSETKMYTVEMEMTNCSEGILHHTENEESSCEKNEELNKEWETLNKERYTAKDDEKHSPEKVKFSRTYTVSGMTDTDVLAHVGMIRNSALQEDRTSNVESTVAMEMTKCIEEFEKGEIASSVDFTRCEGIIGKDTKVDIELDSEITSSINKSIDCLTKLRSALRTPGTKSKQSEVIGPYLGQENNNIIDFTTCAGGMQESTSTLLKDALTNNRVCQKELTGDQMKDTSNVPKSEEDRDDMLGNLSNCEKRESQKISTDENIVTDMKLLHIQHKEAQLSTNNGEMGDFQLRMLKTPNERRTSSITLKRKLQHLDNFVLKGRGKTLRKSDIIGAMPSSTPSFVRSKSSGDGRLGVFESGTTLPESCNIETKADEVIHPQVEKATNFQNNELGWNSYNLKNIQDRLNSNNDDVGSLWNSSSDKDLESLHQKEVQRNTSAETSNLEDEVLQYPCGLSLSTINGNETHSTSTSSESGSETRSEEASQNKSILNALAGLSHSLCISEGPLTVDTFLKLMLAHKAERVQWTRRSSIALIPEIDPDNIEKVLVAKMKTEPEAQLYNKVYQEILAQQERNKEMNQLLDKDLEETQPPIFQSALFLSEKELHKLRKQVQSLQSACIKQTKMAWKKEMKIIGEKFLAELKVNTQRTNEVTEEIVSANETITSFSEDLDSDITKLEEEIAFLESKSLLSEEELLVWQENQEKITLKRKELMDCQTRVDYHKEIKKNLMSKVDALVQEIEEVQKKIDYNQERNTDEQRKLLDDLEQQINVHQSVNEWELETLTEDLAVFLFLKGTLVLSVNIQSHEGAKVIQSVSLSSTLPENANQWDRLAHSLVLSAIDTNVLESTFRKASLPQMLHEVSCIISEARLLVRDVYLSSLRKLVIIQSDKSVTFNIYSIKTLCDILVTFRFDGKRPLSNPVQADVQTILGKVSKEQILKNLSMVRPGPRYVHRLLECINLESEVS